jgi:hydroxyacylglutathione hydrolase
MVLDVRALTEWQTGHIPAAQHLMLGYLPERIGEVPAGKPLLVQCQAGARSAIGASILQANGLTNVMNLKGGFQAWAAAGLPVSRNHD